MCTRYTCGTQGAREISELRAYHHGDLRQALINEGLRLARSGGPDAIVVRDLTRTVGVSPNAAYRHFADRDALVRAIAGEAQQQLAESMRAHISRISESLEPGARSIEVLRAVGFGYIDFARSEPGWFELAFSTHDSRATEEIVTIDEQLVEPFQMLIDALDEMVACGTLAAERRPHAEWACWSVVHGFSGIAAFGPLRWQPDEVIAALSTQVIETIIEGVRGTRSN